MCKKYVNNHKIDICWEKCLNFVIIIWTTEMRMCQLNVYALCLHKCVKLKKGKGTWKVYLKGLQYQDMFKNASLKWLNIKHEKYA